jgi:hypothetical protein
MDTHFKKQLPRKKTPIKRVVLSEEAKRAYEEQAQTREERHRTYGTFVAPPQFRGK